MKMISKVMSKRFIAGIAAATMAVTMTATAFAATTDPNFTKHADTLYTTVANKGDTVDLLAVPADEDWNPTTFSAVEDADPKDGDNDTYWVDWQVSSNNGSIASNVSDITWYGEEWDDGSIVSHAEVTFADNAVVGPTTVRATNSATGQTMDFTVVVDDQNVAAKTGITTIFYPTSNEADKVTVSGMTVAGSDHAGDTAEPAATSYPSAMDTAAKAGATANSGVTNVQIYDPTDANTGGNMLRSVTINGATYASDDETWTGWYYRAYDANGNMVPASEYYSAEALPLENGYTIVWKYGSWDVTFPSTLS